MASTAAASAREILTGLHDIMAKRGSAQSKLDRVVDLIAEAMISDVCSIYLLRDNYLELFATHGLRKEAVHVTRLRMGEGLVGTIAAVGRILNLAEAAQHPAFAYRPETGEERFHSFAGVPIVRLETPIGVLAVQNAEPRRYEDVEIEALQTVAMVLSEMIGAARLVDGARRSRLRSAGPLRLSGLKLVSGMAKGEAVFHEPRIVVEHTVAEDIEAERDRVYAAQDARADRQYGQGSRVRDGRRAPGDPRDLPDVCLRRRLVAADQRSDRQRADCRSGDRASPAADARPDAGD